MNEEVKHSDTQPTQEAHPHSKPMPESGSVEGTATYNAVESLKNYREGRRGKPFSSIQKEVDDSKTVDLVPQAKVDKGETEEQKIKNEEDKESKTDDKGQKSKDEESESEEVDKKDQDSKSKDEEDKQDEESSEEENPEEKEDKEDSDTTEAKNVDEQTDEAEKLDPKTEDLFNRINSLEQKLNEQKDKEAKEAREKQHLQDKEIVEKGFQIEYDVKDYFSEYGDTVKEFFDSEPEVAEAISKTITHALNKVIADMNSYDEVVGRYQGYESEVQEAQRAKVQSQLKDIGIDTKVFASKEFVEFEGSSRYKSQLNDYAERFGFATVEYARHAHDLFERTQADSRSKRSSKVKKEATEAREKVTKKQEVANKTQISGGTRPPVEDPKPRTAAEKYAAWKKKRSQ